MQKIHSEQSVWDSEESTIYTHKTTRCTHHQQTFQTFHRKKETPLAVTVNAAFFFSRDFKTVTPYWRIKKSFLLQC